MFRANLGHTGVYSAAGVPKFTGVKWQIQSHERIISSPAAENGLVYVNSMDKNRYAVDQQTDALKRKFATEGPVVFSPALAGGIVYFASYDGNSTHSTRRPARNGHWRPPVNAVMRAAIFTAYFQRPRPCRTLGIAFFLHPRCGTVPFISEAAMATCMPWTPCRAA
jgi:hypothetical protein